MTRLSCALILTLTTALTACASQPKPVAVVVPIAPPPVVVAMPAGTYPGMPVPALLADGSYATPNQGISAAASVWHFRAGLNFAALGCRGAQENTIVAGYNAMLTAQKPVLARAEAMLASEFRATGGATWRDAYDDAMTRLYNYYALAPARAALCETANRLLTEAQGVTPEAFPAFAAAQLPELDRSVTDVYRAYDAWRQQRPQVSYALAANTAMTQAPRTPWIEVDPAVLRMP
ncbi:hypothetical protein [Sphingomonas sp. PB4P5]|uniref:hypothetical protein n=1 Tax=Parasphingomonas puruogangriensis TaxID=3096155 RepID=UPI002FCC9C69